MSRKGGKEMKGTLSAVLKGLGKVATALAVVSKAGLEVMSLFQD